MLRWLLQRLFPGIFPKSGWEVFREYVRVHPTAVIAPEARLSIPNPPSPPAICIEIGEGSHVFSSFNIIRPHAKITVGKRCQLGSSTFIASESITVGDDVIMAWGCTLMDTNSHSLSWSGREDDVACGLRDYRITPGNIMRSKDWSRVRSEPIVIGDKVWIGMHAIVLRGVTIGDKSVIGAGAIVTSDVPKSCMAAGNPARVIREIPDE